MFVLKSLYSDNSVYFIGNMTVFKMIIVVLFCIFCFIWWLWVSFRLMILILVVFENMVLFLYRLLSLFEVLVCLTTLLLLNICMIFGSCCVFYSVIFNLGWVMCVNSVCGLFWIMLCSSVVFKLMKILFESGDVVSNGVVYTEVLSSTIMVLNLVFLRGW